MSFLEFLKDPEWDVPFYKKLPSNDTGNAPGHQGGLVVLKNMRIYFPKLVGSTSSDRPTIDHGIKALLYDGTEKVCFVTTRYQYQTWSGTRSPESRLTGNLSAIRSLATAGDIMVFQRNLYNLDLYRLILVRKDTPDFNELAPILPSGRWGLLLGDNPVSQNDINRFEEEEFEQESQPFNLFEEERRMVETRSVRIARSIVFRHAIQKIYQNKCVVCGSGLKTPSGITEIDAAHIIPKSFFGSDDARNGLALCKRHHWAFDHGMFSINDAYRIIIPDNVLTISCNRILSEYRGREIINPVDERLRPEQSALLWHRKHILIA